jgi:hypothetical protein
VDEPGLAHPPASLLEQEYYNVYESDAYGSWEGGSGLRIVADAFAAAGVAQSKRRVQIAESLYQHVPSVRAAINARYAGLFIEEYLQWPVRLHEFWFPVYYCPENAPVPYSAQIASDVLARGLPSSASRITRAGYWAPGGSLWVQYAGAPDTYPVALSLYRYLGGSLVPFRSTITASEPPALGWDTETQIHYLPDAGERDWMLHQPVVVGIWMNDGSVSTTLPINP